MILQNYNMWKNMKYKSNIKQYMLSSWNDKKHFLFWSQDSKSEQARLSALSCAVSLMALSMGGDEEEDEGWLFYFVSIKSLVFLPFFFLCCQLLLSVSLSPSEAAPPSSRPYSPCCEAVLCISSLCARLCHPGISSKSSVLYSFSWSLIGSPHPQLYWNLV